MQETEVCTGLLTVRLSWHKDLDAEETDFPNSGWCLAFTDAGQDYSICHSDVILDADDRDNCREWLEEHEMACGEFTPIDQDGYLVDDWGIVTAWRRQPDGTWLVYVDADLYEDVEGLEPFEFPTPRQDRGESSEEKEKAMSEQETRRCSQCGDEEGEGDRALLECTHCGDLFCFECYSGSEEIACPACARQIADSEEE